MPLKRVCEVCGEPARDRRIRCHNCDTLVRVLCYDREEGICIHCLEDPTTLMRKTLKQLI